MEIKRRIQLTAAIVAANGLFALMTMAPQQALASTCGTQRVCGWESDGTCLDNAYIACPSVPNCTLVSATCVAEICANMFPYPLLYVDCTYQ